MQPYTNLQLQELEKNQIFSKLGNSFEDKCTGRHRVGMKPVY